MLKISRGQKIKYALIVLLIAIISVGSYFGIHFFEANKFAKAGDKSIQGTRYAEAAKSYAVSNSLWQNTEVSKKKDGAEKLILSQSWYDNGEIHFSKLEWQMCVVSFGKVADDFPLSNNAKSRVAECQAKIDEAKKTEEAVAKAEAEAAKKTQINSTSKQKSAKYIDVDIYKMTMSLVENSTTTFFSKISTGDRFGSDSGKTPVGAYTINSKSQISPSGLRWWQSFKGEYGIHTALAGGTAGCIGLPEEKAKALYDWTTIGTVIKISDSNPRPECDAVAVQAYRDYEAGLITSDEATSRTNACYDS